MLLKIYRSFTYAFSGLWHAVSTERNLKLILLVCSIIFLLAFLLDIQSLEWMILLLAAGMNIATELINTSLERFADAFERHAQKKNDPTHYNLMKATKDVAAAAAFVSGGTGIIVAIIIFWPYLTEFIVNSL